MSRLPPDAGLTVLELVVALAIVAGLLAMMAATIHPFGPSPDGEAARLSRFVADARTDAILSGKARLLKIAPAGMSYGGKHIEWSSDTQVLAPTTTASHDVTVFPDGSLSGAGLSIETAGLAKSVDAIFRDSGAVAP